MKVREYLTYRLIFGLFLKLKEFMVRQLSLLNYFASDTKNFVALFFFLEACNKKFQQANANANKNAESLLLGDEFCCQRPRCRYTTFSFGIQNECCMS